MMEKRLIKRTLRYNRTSHNRHLEALICLYKDCIYIKVDTVYDDASPRVTHYETFITTLERYKGIIGILMNNGTTEKLSYSVKAVLEKWKAEGLFAFDKEDIISIKGGQNDENIRKN